LQSKCLKVIHYYIPFYQCQVECHHLDLKNKPCFKSLPDLTLQSETKLTVSE
jgi:hypothetical protein